MDKSKTDIQKSIKQLFIKILILNFFALAALLSISILYTSYFKQRLAEQLSDSFRTSLINGDNRQIILDMARPVLKDFSGVKWLTQNITNNFSIPERFSEKNIFLSGTSKVNIFFDDENKFKYGELRFYYNRWSYLSLALILWIILFIFFLELGFMEKRRILKEYALFVESEINKSVANLSIQVAHDIRSPLAALDCAIKGINIPPEQQELINSATARINAIADDLLKRHRKETEEGRGLEGLNVGGLAEEKQNNVEKTDLAKIIESILIEKKIQYPDISFSFERPENPVLSEVEPKEFSRIISNLLNNSAEAMELNAKRSVKLSLKSELDKVILIVKDNGKGIPYEILNRIGQKGFTYGKEVGNGIGLYHARVNIEQWGGSFAISSEPGKGTEIKIILPYSYNYTIPQYSAVVLIDDDMLVRKNWELSARNKGISIKTFKNTEEFLKVADIFPRNTGIYIDSELEGGIKGEEAARQIFSLGFSEIYLETGHCKEKFKGLGYIKGIIGKEPPF